MINQSVFDPSVRSAERNLMDSYWRMVDDILAGPDAIKARGEHYLPKSSRERNEDYRLRREAAPWRPEFADILRALTSKPFGKDVRVKGSAPDLIQGRIDPATGSRRDGFVDDVDGAGSNLTTFAREWFGYGLSHGIHAVLVDYPTMPERVNLAEELAIGARPYWVHIPADSIIALFTDMVGGREIVTHLRYASTEVVRDGFSETTVEKITVLEPGSAEVFERTADGSWVSQGIKRISRNGKTDAVSVVLFRTGTRQGALAVIPPLRDLAHLQIELYRALSRKEEILTYAGAPMLAANGMTPPTSGESIDVGPRSVLFAPPIGDGVRPHWEFVQPTAANITEIRNDVAAVQADMRRIGMQPLLEGVGNSTATGLAIDAAKAHSSVKAWALLLNDAIERAMTFTAEFYGIPATIETEVSTDFSVEPYARAPLEALAGAHATKAISHQAYLEGLKRFDVLTADFDIAADRALLMAETANPQVTVDEVVQIRE